ncbi:MAG TPA: MFS transporter [Casimicrobiaceae bacterium]|nr:MFS transporter [Casimicrobiaceae bacterium]
MTALERRATLALASISGLRMLGMFIVLPVFALFAETLPGGRDRTLVGIALGAYGLTQAVLQVPFGWASDRWGRRPVIYSGLALFACGSFIAAWAPTIGWTIVGRAIQGAGAVSAAVIALLSDVTRDAVRTRAMAVIGITIATTFAVSLVAGPLLGATIGVPGIFALTGLFALAAIVVVRFGIPHAPALAQPKRAPTRAAFRRVLVDPNLLRLNYGIFALHALFMALFIEMPFALRDNGVAAERQWTVYLPVIVLAGASMWPFARAADQPGRGKVVFVGAVGMLLVAQVVLALGLHSLPMLVTGLLLFFTAFNLLEAMLPALVSRYAPAELKGSAVGVYASVQFLGVFVGAAFGGWLAQHTGPAAVFGFGVALTAIWLAVGATMAAPPAYRSTYSMGET